MTDQTLQDARDAMEANGEWLRRAARALRARVKPKNNRRGDSAYYAELQARSVAARRRNKRRKRGGA